MKKRGIIYTDYNDYKMLFNDELIAKMNQYITIENKCYKYEDLNNADYLDVHFIFSTWQIAPLTKDEIKNIFPNLEAVFYCAGSVQHFAKPFLENDIKVFSAWAANAIPVAEFCVGEILLANKGTFYAMRNRFNNKICHHDVNNICGKYAGNFNKNIGLLGAGMIGKKVIEFLSPYDLNLFVYDPFLTDEVAKELGVKKLSLEDVFKTCHVVSNHLANNEDTQRMITGLHLNSMPSYGTFINTGRGAQVCEDELIEVMKSRLDLTALLDVTFPDEPPANNCLLYTLENVFLTPHIAGSIPYEYCRMTDYMIDEMINLLSNKPLQYNVTLKMLKTMA